MAIKIIADSTCDLPEEIIKRHDITIIPLSVLTGDRAYKDGDISNEEMFKWVEENKTLPTTSAPNIGVAADNIGPVVGTGNEAIIITISSEISSTYSNCVTASKLVDMETKRVVIDSRSLSAGTGLLVLKAVELIETGLNIEAVADGLELYKERINASFIVDGLEYLKVGGRCSNASAFVGSIVKIHPILRLKDGKIVASGKIRGSMKIAIPKYIEMLDDELKNANKDRIFIIHTSAEKDTLDAVKLALKNDYGFKEVIEQPAGSVISCHCGPGTVGLMFAN